MSSEEQAKDFVKVSDELRDSDKEKLRSKFLSDLGNDILSRGISVRNFNYAVGFVTVLISVILIFSTYRTNHGYSIVQENTRDFVMWQRHAYDLQIALEYLTEQTRDFVETGKLQYIRNYFNETSVNRRRDKAIASVAKYLSNAEIYAAFKRALDGSNELMVWEMYAMRLTASAYLYKDSELPEQLHVISLTSRDAELTSGLKALRARSLVFSGAYRKKRARILDDMNICVNLLAEKVNSLQTDTLGNLRKILGSQQFFLVLLISITVATMLFTLFLVIRPLVKAVLYIQDELPIPVWGSDEFQFLARAYNLMFKNQKRQLHEAKTMADTYNTMYHNTLDQKEHLAYEATHDKLTGVYNREGYAEIVEKTDMSGAALMVIDVDKFKRINDTYGHTVGDLVLREVANTLRDSFRSQDYVCRIGGDEFAVIMLRVTPALIDVVRQKVERINEILSSPEADENLPAVSVSCGVAFGSRDKCFKELFTDADEALYKVKKLGGKNCEFAV